jgi:cob(I)alamin adenosyltransferase
MYTRQGDKGETSLYGSRRVPKDSPRVEAYGTIDELNSILGVVVAGARDRKTAASLKEIQRMLFVAGGDVASELRGSAGVPRISPADTARIEVMTDRVLKGLPSLSNFILPGGNPSASLLHLARAVCRRAERRILTASKSEDLNPELIPFFNRLSTYLFDLARDINRKAGKKDEVWKRG